MRQGFTLVELLAVVAIIAILASVVIMAIGNSTGAAQDAALRRQEQILNSAYQCYVAAGGAAISNTNASIALSALLDNTPLQYGVSGPFLLASPPMQMTRGNSVVSTLSFNGSKFLYTP